MYFLIRDWGYKATNDMHDVLHWVMESDWYYNTEFMQSLNQVHNNSIQLVNVTIYHFDDIHYMEEYFKEYNGPYSFLFREVKDELRNMVEGKLHFHEPYHDITNTDAYLFLYPNEELEDLFS